MTEARFDHGARLTKLRAAMEAHGVDVVLLSVGADLPWLLGFDAHPSERLTMAVVPASGDVRLVVPELEAPLVEVPDGLFEVVAWGETSNPLDLVATFVGDAEQAAIGDHTWARFLVGLQERVSGLHFRPASTLLAPLRVIKDDEEIRLLRTAGAAADTVSAALPSERFSGRTELDLARSIADATVAAGHDVADFTIVASGPNSASPHHQPGDRAMARGDVVVVDFGGTIAGYHSDTTRTYCVGEPTSDVAAAYEVLQEAQRVGRQAAKIGVAASKIDAATRAVIEDAGYGEYFIHRTGHGIGLEVHEEPYLVDGNETALQPGMAFSIEPGIYVPGQWGMRLEDIVVATDGGPEALNNAERSLVIVG